MSDALTLARQFRARLLQQDAAAQEEILRTYEKLWQRLTAEIERVAQQIAEAGSSPSLVFEQQRLQHLQDQLALEIDRVSSFASNLTLRNQSAAIKAARLQATELMRAAGRDAGARVTFASLATDEVAHLVGVARDGSPVADLFKQLARLFKLESSDIIKQELIAGVTLGKNPREIARAIRRSVDGQPSPQEDPRIVRRLNTAVRSEVLGSYREATRLGYEQNAHLLDGWVWTAVRSPTTCVLCWAMDGTIFPAGAPFVSHINCRCVARPLLPGQSVGQTGPDAFAQLEIGVQRSILGDTAFSAYESGMLELQDFVGIRSDWRWGDSRYRRSLEDILGRATLRKLRMPN
jgi:Phage Mu protein F like protein